MAYTVKQLSSLAGVSARTLHFYDEIGLLKPAAHGENGYRYYDEEAVLRLQQILFFRELDFSLNEIKEIIDRPEFDVLDALRAQRAALQERVKRLNRLIRTVDQTVLHMKGKVEMAPKEIFEGFSDEQQAQYERQAEALWGETVRESSRKWKAYSTAQKDRIMAEGKAIYQDLIGQLDEPPTSPAVQANIARWHQHLRYFYEPSVAILRGLGQAYVENADFNATFQRMNPKLAPFMHAAIEVYCDKLAR
jgi:DNA-binding transcriptional MerR regulator